MILRMSYVCPFCGDLGEKDIWMVCGRCGGEDVSPEDDTFVCPNCGIIDEDELGLECSVCGSGEIMK